MVHSSIPTLRMLRDKLGCRKKQNMEFAGMNVILLPIKLRLSSMELLETNST